MFLQSMVLGSVSVRKKPYVVDKCDLRAGMHIANRLLHVNLFSQVAMKKRVFDIYLILATGLRQHSLT